MFYAYVHNPNIFPYHAVPYPILFHSSHMDSAYIVTNAVRDLTNMDLCNCYAHSSYQFGHTFEKCTGSRYISHSLSVWLQQHWTELFGNVYPWYISSKSTVIGILRMLWKYLIPLLYFHPEYNFLPVHNYVSIYFASISTSYFRMILIIITKTV